VCNEWKSCPNLIFRDSTFYDDVNCSNFVRASRAWRVDSEYIKIYTNTWSYCKDMWGKKCFKAENSPKVMCDLTANSNKASTFKLPYNNRSYVFTLVILFYPTVSVYLTFWQVYARQTRELVPPFFSFACGATLPRYPISSFGTSPRVFRPPSESQL